MRPSEPVALTTAGRSTPLAGGFEVTKAAGRQTWGRGEISGSRALATLAAVALVVALLPGALALNAAQGDTLQVTEVEDSFQAPPEPQPFAGFGTSVAAVGDSLLVGAPRHNIDDEGNAGQAYLLDQGGNPLATLRAPDPRANAHFGTSVAGTGDDILVGAPGQAIDDLLGAGEAYLFDQAGDPLATLRAPDPQVNALFGHSVAAVGDNILVGAPRHDVGDLGDAGAAYLLDREGDVLATFQDPDPQANAQFGHAVAAVGDSVLVGAHLSEVGGQAFAGRAYLFDRDGDVLATLEAPDPEAGTLFGHSVAAVGENVLVGAPGRTVDDLANAGEAYLFDQAGDLLGALQAADPESGAQFGTSVAGAGDRVLVGAPAHGVDGAFAAGQAYLFSQEGNWLDTLQAFDAQSSARFGTSVAGVGDNVLVGAPRHDVDDDVELRDAGQAYLFGEGADAPTMAPVWLPPVTNSEFALQDGTTLPLTFRLVDEGGDLLTEQQVVHLVVDGPCLGPDHVRWDLGDGRDSLRFDEEEAAYTANFHTRDHDLDDDRECSATVHDENGAPLDDSVTFNVSTEKGTGRGKGSS